MNLGMGKLHWLRLLEVRFLHLLGVPILPDNYIYQFHALNQEIRTNLCLSVLLRSVNIKSNLPSSTLSLLFFKSSLY